MHRIAPVKTVARDLCRLDLVFVAFDANFASFHLVEHHFIDLQSSLEYICVYVWNIETLLYL